MTLQLLWERRPWLEQTTDVGSVWNSREGPWRGQVANTTRNWTHFSVTKHLWWKDNAVNFLPSFPSTKLDKLRLQKGAESLSLPPVIAGSI